MEGIAFNLLDDDQRARLVEAVYEGARTSREISRGKAHRGGPVRPDIEEKLDEILALLSRYR